MGNGQYSIWAVVLSRTNQSFTSRNVSRAEHAETESRISLQAEHLSLGGSEEGGRMGLFFLGG